MVPPIQLQPLFQKWRKTVSFTSSIPLESDKKNAHDQRRAISVRGTSFHSETGLGLWLKRKPFPHLRTETRTKRNQASADWNQASADWNDCSCETGLGLRLKRKPFPHPQSEARSKHFRVNVRLATFPAAVSSRRPPELAARQKRTLSERQGSRRERRQKWRLLQGSKLTVWTQNDRIFFFSRRMRASEVIFRTLAKERHRSETGLGLRLKRKPFPHPQSEASSSKHFRVNVRLATFPAVGLDKKSEL